MLAVFAGPRGAPAQRVAVRELQAGASGIVATRDFWGVEVGVARRPGQRRERVTVAVGDAAGAVGVRVGAAVQFVLKPTARSGTSPYAGAGLTYAGARGARGAGYLAVMLGLEAAPGRTRGWYVELGLEGGVRLVAGLRWRTYKGRSVERPIRYVPATASDQLSAPTGTVRPTTGRQ